MAEGEIVIHQRKIEPWRVALVDTGDGTMTGGRLKRVADYVRDVESFCFTYGDGLSDVNIRKLIAFHSKHGKWATVTAVRPPGRYGALAIENDQVTDFVEKPLGDGGMINGGFFVLSPKCIDLIEADETPWEASPMSQLASMGQMMAFPHHGFWQPMDTLREKRLLEELWTSGKAPWKAWS